MKPERQKISSGTIWEKKVGYSRAIRIANQVEVAGTTAIDEQGNLIGENDAYAQAVFILQKIEKALHQAGASLNDVTRTRMYLVDENDWQKVGEAHAQFFADVLPASTMLIVKGLIDARLLIEIEVSAYIHA